MTRPTTEQPKNDIDLTAVNPVMDNSIVEITLNSVKLLVPKKYMNDKTAIAGKINASGRVAFHRCKPENMGKYSTHETPQGVIAFGENFRSALKALVK